jgi:hypothetical protein
MKINKILEATRPYVEKIIDPALMTFSEYYTMANERDKFHPSSAYETNVSDLNAEWRGNPREKYENLINTITVKGLVFEVREHIDDRWEGKYVKTDSDGNVVRNENKEIMYYDENEIKLIIPEEKRFRYEYAIVKKDTGELVGVTQDEWGTLLVMVASEYNKFGFGTLLVKLAREKRPDRPSGGFTPQGLANFKRVHSQMIRDYMESGFYSHLIKSGVISVGRAKEIISSIKTSRPKKDDKNLSSDDPKNWVVLTDGSTYAVLYDRGLLKLDFDKDEYWISNFIKGFISIGGSNPNMIWIEKTYGNDNIVGKLLEILLSGEVGEKILLEEDEYKRFGTIPNLKTKKAERNRIYVWLEYSNINVNRLVQLELRIRKPIDPYDEKRHRIQELAEQIAK